MSAGLVLRRGDDGPGVASVRERLVATGDLTDTSSTAFTEDVERAVRSFQQRRGLLVDGIVGPQTYRALEAARWSARRRRSIRC